MIAFQESGVSLEKTKEYDPKALDRFGKELRFLYPSTKYLRV